MDMVESGMLMAVSFLIAYVGWELPGRAGKGIMAIGIVYFLYATYRLSEAAHWAIW
jgi:hypothetical protein